MTTKHSAEMTTALASSTTNSPSESLTKALDGAEKAIRTARMYPSGPYNEAQKQIMAREIRRARSALRHALAVVTAFNTEGR